MLKSLHCPICGQNARVVAAVRDSDVVMVSLECMTCPDHLSSSINLPAEVVGQYDLQGEEVEEDRLYIVLDWRTGTDANEALPSIKGPFNTLNEAVTSAGDLPHGWHPGTECPMQAVGAAVQVHAIEIGGAMDLSSPAE